MTCCGDYGSEGGEEVEGEWVARCEGGVDASALGPCACRVEVDGVEHAVGFYLGAVARGLLDAGVLVVVLYGRWGAEEGGICCGLVGCSRSGEGCARYGHVLDGILTVGGEEVGRVFDFRVRV